MKTDQSTAYRFIRLFFEKLRDRLSDPRAVRNRIGAIRDHAPTFPETLFCKGCVLPILDTVVTRFLKDEFGSPVSKVRAALRCEGFSTLPKIYSPSADQSGFSGFTWGANYQAVSKTGRIAVPGAKGFQPCPDFGVVHQKPSFKILGETKFSENDRNLSTSDTVRDLKYYMGLPCEPEKGWEYDFGIGIVYAAGEATPRNAELIVDHWETSRFMLARFFG